MAARYRLASISTYVFLALTLITFVLSVIDSIVGYENCEGKEPLASDDLDPCKALLVDDLAMDVVALVNALLAYFSWRFVREYDAIMIRGQAWRLGVVILVSIGVLAYAYFRGQWDTVATLLAAQTVFAAVFAGQLFGLAHDIEAGRVRPPSQQLR